MQALDDFSNVLMIAAAGRARRALLQARQQRPRVILADARLGALAERVRRATGSTSAETFVEVDEGPKIDG
jgi:hypothetical protein